MSKVVSFLNEAKMFFFATVENDQPRVRPFGASMSYNGKVYMSTNNQNHAYQQFLKNPKVEVCGVANGQWLRVTGNAVVDDTMEARKAMFAANPFLERNYSPEDETLSVFYLDNMKALLYGHGSAPTELED